MASAPLEIESAESRRSRDANDASWLERAYRRHGARYPVAAMRAVLELALVNVVLSIAALALYVHMSFGEFARISLVGVLWMAAHDAVYIGLAARHLRPAIAWVEGPRDEASTRAAWQAFASCPRAMLHKAWFDPLLGGLSYAGLGLWVGYVVWELKLPGYTAFPLFAGVAVFVLYLNVLRFLGFERVLRPVLRDIARASGDGTDAYTPGLSLRTRLLAALPAINVVTGVVTVGIAGQGHNLELADLGLAAIVSTGIAGTICGALILLLAESVTAPIEALHAATERVGRGEFSARVPVVTTDETGALARSFNQMAAGLEQRERLREAFGTFVDPALTERVLEEGTDFAGEEVEVSLLFMDIRGFTTYSENADARDVVARLNDLYGAVVPVILRHGGHANKFIGDGLLAIFGAPDRLPDHADRAVAAALDVADLVRDRYRGELRVGIGVNSGRVVVGTIGGGGRLDFTVIGDAVNTAARVESATRQTDDEVLITDATRSAMSRAIGKWEERPPVALKGKSQEVRLFGPSRDPGSATIDSHM